MKLCTAGREASLTIGPWRHADLSALGETVRQALPLFRRTLFEASPAPRRFPVRLFVMGAAEKWREYESWFPPGCSRVTYYPSPGGELSTSLPLPSEPSCYDYDSSDPTPAVHGATLQGGPALGDMAKLECRSDVLLFISETLNTALEVIGPVSARVFFKSSLEHIDFFLCLLGAARDKQAQPVSRAVTIRIGMVRDYGEPCARRPQPSSHLGASICPPFLVFPRSRMLPDTKRRDCRIFTYTCY